MEDYKLQDKEYYPELQATLRSYDEKLWQIPVLFSAVVALILSSIEFEKIISISIKNIIVLFFGAIFLFLLILLYYKAHFFHISIQKKINQFDGEFKKGKKDRIKRIPLTSMMTSELEERLEELKKTQNAGFESSPFQEWLIKRRVSSYIKFAMLLTFIINVFFLFLSIKFLFLSNNFLLKLWHIYF